MYECIVKRIVVKKLNKLLKDFDGDVDKAKETIRVWLNRVNLVSSCLEKLLAKVDDKELTPEEIEQAVKDLEQLAKEIK